MKVYTVIETKIHHVVSENDKEALEKAKYNTADERKFAIATRREVGDVSEN